MVSTPRFYVIYIEITNACNFDCDFCPSESQTRKKLFMETAFAKKIISEIAEYNLSNRITLHIMGEPLLHKGVVELCQFAEDLGISVRLLTNGSLLSKEMNKKLFESGLSDLEISIRTPDDLSFNQRIKSQKITFDDYKNKIKLLLADKIEGSYKTNIMLKFFKKDIFFNFLSLRNTRHLTNPEANSSIIKEFYEFCLETASQLGKDTSSYRNIKISPFQDYITIYDGITIANGRLFSLFLTENKQYKSYSKAVFGACNAFKNDFGILVNGDVTTCCLDYNGLNAVGNIKDKKIVDILELNKTKSIRENFDRFRPTLDFCKICLGSPGLFSSAIKQATSVAKAIYAR